MIYFLYVINDKTFHSDDNDWKIVLNFENRNSKLCHLDLNSSGEYKYIFLSMNFGILLTDVSESIIWETNVPTPDCTSHLKAISTSSLAKNNIPASDVLLKTQTNHFSSALIFFASPSSLLLFISSAHPHCSLKITNLPRLHRFLLLLYPKPNYASLD